MIKKIKVAFFSDVLERDVDGAVRTMYQLIDRIPDDKFEYLFVCGTLPERDTKHRFIKLPACVVPFNTAYKMVLPMLRRKTLTKTLRDFQPDVIHVATPSNLGFFAINYAKNNHIPVLSIYHTHFISYVKYYLKPFPFFIHIAEMAVEKKYNDFYRRCNVVYVPTKPMINELNKMGIPISSLKLWQRGLDTKLFHPSKKDTKFIQRITGNNRPCVLFVSRLVWEKNLETLFNIYDEIEKQHHPVNFIVAGTGLAEEVARNRMKKAIFLGHINHAMLAKVYASCQILIFPSVSETYGNVVVEAMASGCVPIIAKGGGSQSLVKENETGFLCEPNNAKEYVDKLAILLFQSEIMQKMQHAGLEYTSMLSWETLAEEYFNDLENLSRITPTKVRVFSLYDFILSKSNSKQLAANSI